MGIIIVTTMSFSDVVETIKGLSFTEKQELQTLLAQYLREEKREEIYKSYQESLDEEQENSLDFSADINELKQLIDIDAVLVDIGNHDQVY